MKIEITARQADVIISALKLWGKTRYNKEDKIMAYDLIDIIFDAIDNNKSI